MRNYLLGLAGLALLAGAPLRAQAPQAYIGQSGSGGRGAASEIRVGPGGAQGEIICVPEHYTDKKNHWCYGHQDLRVCICFYHGLFGKCGCDNGHCEHPYCKRVMMKKLRVEERERTRCVPKEVPCCENGHCAAPGGPAGCLSGVVAPGAPLIPPPGMAPPLPGPPAR